jgi:hypothetical protein
MNDRALLLPRVIVALLLVLRLSAVFLHDFDSDEAQHLHVIHAWARGELPYRDTFDNHTPLFHAVFLPFAVLAGETEHVVALARLALVPASFGVLIVFFGLARRLYGREVAWWALAVVLAFADWSLKAIEFRPDVLWTLLWFAALRFLVAAPGWRSFGAAGLLLGAALMTSVKTTLLLAALGMGWAAAWAVAPAFRQMYPPRRILECAVAGAAGFAVAPALFLGWFASQGALEAMRFCLVEINQPEAPSPARVVLFAVGAAAALAMGWRMRSQGERAAIFLAAAFYALLVVGFSPSLKKQTFLPAYPLLILAGIGAAQAWKSRRLPWAEAALCAGLLVHQLTESPPWRDGLAGERALLRDVLRLTKPGDCVLDVKGETIFRRRPVYWLYVQAVVRGLESGRLAEEAPARLTRTRTAVVVGSGAGLPDGLRKFVKDHYVPAGGGLLRVAGHVAERGAVDLPVAGDYVILAEGVTPAGELPAAQAGRNAIAASPARQLVYWKAAWDAGFRPLVSEIRDLR